MEERRREEGGERQEMRESNIQAHGSTRGCPEGAQKRLDHILPCRGERGRMPSYYILCKLWEG